MSANTLQISWPSPLVMASVRAIAQNLFRRSAHAIMCKTVPTERRSRSRRELVLTEVNSRMARLGPCQPEIKVFVGLAHDGEMGPGVDKPSMTSCSRSRDCIVCSYYVDTEREPPVRAHHCTIDDSVCVFCQGCNPFPIGDGQYLRPVWCLQLWNRLQTAQQSCQYIRDVHRKGCHNELTSGGGLISVTTIATPESGLDSSAETGGPSIPLPP